MNKVKVRFITILSLCAAMLVTLAFGAWAACSGRIGANAAITGVDYAPSDVFSVGSGGEVGASEGDGDRFVQFSFVNNGTVYFRRDLAYKWYVADTENSTSPLNNPGVAKYFSMAFAFASADFTQYTISFGSTEENVSKEGRAVNDLVFRPLATGGLQVAVRDAKNRDTKADDLTWLTIAENAADALANIYVGFSAASTAGSFTVTLSMGADEGSAAEKATVEFTNIGGNYAEYRSASSSTPNTPITFTMELSDEVTEAQVLMKSLNGQSFVLDEDGNVTDETPPVLAVNEEVYAFRLGQRYNFTAYEAIDVCKDSLSVTRSYYIAATDGKGNYTIPAESATGGDSEYNSLTTSTFFMPSASTSGALTDQYVSIRFNLDDGRGRDNDDRTAEYVYLSWYAADTTNEGGIVKTLPVTNPEAGKRYPDFIVVTPDEQEAPYFTGVKADTQSEQNVYTDGSGDAYNDAVRSYQTDVDTAAEKANAGSGAYIYLPSLRSLIGSDYADYRDLSFTIYYWHESQEVGSSPSSESSLSYNNLRFEVDKEGTYTFRIVAEDAAGNEMKLYDEDGELVTLSSDTVGYDDGGMDLRISSAYLPVFTATIVYNGATIEDPGSQDYGYRDSSYSVEEFEIIALEGYASDYSLYYVDQDRLAAGQTAPQYSECVNNAQSLFFAENAPYAGSLVNIREYNDDVTEDDEAWEDTDNDYAWNPSSSLSFTPRRSGIYFVELTVTEQTGATVTSYMAIEVRNPVDIIPGVSQWLQNNTVSVVLFSISAVLAVVIVILFVVKPSDKAVEEVDLEKLKGRKNKKK